MHGNRSQRCRFQLRGVADLILRRGLGHLTIVCECHSEIRRLEAVLRRLAEKEDAVRAQSPPTEVVTSMLLLRSTRQTREVAASFAATLSTAFPARTVDVLDALRGSAAWPGSGIVWARVDDGRAEILDAPPRGCRVGR